MQNLINNNKNDNSSNIMALSSNVMIVVIRKQMVTIKVLKSDRVNNSDDGK